MTEIAVILVVVAAVGISAFWFASDLLALVHRPANWLLRLVGWQEAPATTEDVNLPLQRMKGQRGVLLHEFSNGRSRAKIGHSEWIVELEDGCIVPKAGEAIVVRGVVNGLLQVEGVEDESA